MTLYARSDVMSVAAGGCGQVHSRPVVNGAPKKLFKLDCPDCEPLLAGSPQWSASRYEIPLTPDEERETEQLEKKAATLLKHREAEAARALADAVAAQANAADDEDSDDEPELSSLHVKTLQKMCRDAGLPDKGTKAQLIERLS